MPQLAAGDRAPEFVLPDQDGRTVSLEDLRSSTDKGVIVYFYPKAAPRRRATSETPWRG